MILLLVLVACAVQTPRLPAGEIPCTLDAKVCPDGSAVGRNGTNNCEFDPCPSIKNECPIDTKRCADGISVSRNPDKNCEFDTCPFQVDVNFVASYRDGNVSYVAKIEKDTPCDTLNVTEQILESYPVQVRVNVETILPAPNTYCAQVQSVEVVRGSIKTEKPGSLTVFLDGIQLYSTKEFE